jgi:hypothetical protein
MLDEHERHSRIGGDTLEQLRERLQAARRRADTGDRKRLSAIGDTLLSAIVGAPLPKIRGAPLSGAIR